MSSKSRNIAIIGLGYVGLPIVVEFAKTRKVTAFDIDSSRICELKNCNDKICEIQAKDLKTANLHFTSNPSELEHADFYIVTVPTPVNKAKQPDLNCLIKASELIGKNLKKQNIVVYESTVYPGATEEICIPILEQFSNLKHEADFFVGYSPERINPGDKEHTFKNTCKIVAAQNPCTLSIISDIYSSVVTGGIHEVSSIKVAEAAKAIENTQRDINIALVNELAIIFQKLNIDTSEVLAAACTKWNFLPFKPGLVGGHCVGVDPYYLAYKAHAIGINPDVILSGRRVNDEMGKYIAEQTTKKIIELGLHTKEITVAILGLTFKENCRDIRNTKVIDIIEELNSRGIKNIVHDPIADAEKTKSEYGVNLCSWEDISSAKVVVLAVAHKFYLNHVAKNILNKTLRPRLIIDVKSVLDLKVLKQSDLIIWQL